MALLFLCRYPRSASRLGVVGADDWYTTGLADPSLPEPSYVDSLSASDCDFISMPHYLSPNA